MSAMWVRIHWYRLLSGVYYRLAGAIWWLHDRWHQEDAPYHCDMCDEREFLRAVAR